MTILRTRRALGLGLGLGALLLPLLFAACRSAPTPAPPAEAPTGRPIERGLASWYGPGFAGRATANGEVFDPGELTAAHKTLPFGSWVQVVNQDNGRAVTVRINDRGPFVRKRIIDLSRAAAEEIGLIGPGIARVELYLLGEAPRPVARAVPPEGPFTGPFTVQVGAFQEAWRAHVLQGELAGDYPQAEIASDGVWHRVRVGLFPLRGEAEALMRQLAAQGYSAMVVAISPESPGRP